MSSVDTPLGRPIRLDDGVFVHDWLIYQDKRGSWWAYRNESHMFSTERDELLLQIAHATGAAPDLEDLRARLIRSVTRAARRLKEDEAYRNATHGKQAGGHGPL